jgi:hypothetical protein
MAPLLKTPPARQATRSTLAVHRNARFDVRTYPTPTLLYKGKDLFGMPKPSPPFSEPS